MISHDDANEKDSQHGIWDSKANGNTYKDIVTNLFGGFPSLNLLNKSSSVDEISLQAHSCSTDEEATNSGNITGNVVAEALRNFILSTPTQVIPSSTLSKFYAVFPEAESLIKVYGGLKKFVQSYSNYLIYELDPSHPKRGTLQIRAAPSTTPQSSSPFKYSFTIPAQTSINATYGRDYNNNLFGSNSLDSTLESTSNSGRSTIFSSSSSSRDQSEKTIFINSSSSRDQSEKVGSLYHDVPEEFICPLTKVMMKNPFIDPEGNSYEMDAIMAYVAIHKESPITKKALSAINLDKNLVLQQKIEAFRLIPQVALSENNLMSLSSASMETTPTKGKQQQPSSSTKITRECLFCDQSDADKMLSFPIIVKIKEIQLKSGAGVSIIKDRISKITNVPEGCREIWVSGSLSQIAIAKKMIEDLITYELHAPSTPIPPHHRKHSTPTKSPMVSSPMTPSLLTVAPQTHTSNLFKYLRENHSKLNVLVIGQTRSGKSSFIRSMKYLFNSSTDNYLKTPLSVEFREKMGIAVFEKGILPHEQLEEEHTSKCINNYLIFPDRHLIIDFIDTPGLRSNNVNNQNEELLKDMNNFLKNIPQVAYIIFVVDGTQESISEEIQIAVTSLITDYPKLKNSKIMVVLSHSPIMNQQQFQVSLSPLLSSFPLCKDSPFYFVENLNAVADLTLVSGTTLDQYVSLLNSISGGLRPDHLPLKSESSKGPAKSEVVVKKEDEKDKEIAQSVDDLSKSAIDEIRSDLQSIKLKMKGLQSMQRLLEQAERSVDSMDKGQYRSFIATKSVIETKFKDTPYYNMLCTICNRVCHENCKCVKLGDLCIDISKRDDVNVFLNCPAFSGGDSCSQCSSECSYKSHYYFKRSIVSETRSLQKSLKDLRSLS